MIRKIVLTLLCAAFVQQFAAAQNLLPIVKDKQGVQNTGSVTKASYSVGPDSSPAASAAPVAAAPKTSGRTRSGAAPTVAKNVARLVIPRLSREMPSAKVSRGYISSIRTNIHFRVKRTELDNGYLDNGLSIEEFMALVDSLGASTLASVEIVSKASPEGSVQLNDSLAAGRCRTIVDYIKAEYPALAGIISSSPDGESWDELRAYVVKDPNLSQDSRSAVLRIIDNERDLDRREAALKKIGSAPEVGDIYKYLFKNYFSLIRNTGIYIVRK